MRKTKLATAVSLALAGSAGTMGTAQAVNVNPDGVGEVLIFPYYTVRDGYDTLFSIVNTRNEVKAIKVRFLEGKNSKEVLDFNLYLSPFDIWTGALVQTEEGARLTTRDTSCTVPAFPEEGVEFRNTIFAEVEPDGADASLDRTREGYFEIIEMGVVEDGAEGGFQPATSATHVDGVPRDCGVLLDAWRPGGAWIQNRLQNITLNPGGLFAKAILIDVQEGVAYGYKATAIEDFLLDPEHTNPGEVLPSLASGLPESNVFTGMGVVNSFWADPVDAVSAVLMHEDVMNQFVTEAGLNGGTDWVVNFPTKQFYVNEASAAPPFSEPFTPQGACERVELSMWDREERQRIGDVDFSPRPPVGINALCWEVNVVTFNNTNVLGSGLGLNVNTGDVGENGWMRIRFAEDEHRLDAQDGAVYFGLPAIGFGVQKYVNGDVGGTLANYGGLFEHALSRNISEAAPAEPLVD